MTIILPQRGRPYTQALAALVLAGASASPALAQQRSAADSAGVSVSGVLFANYQYRLHPSGSANRFDLERAYLTLRGSLGDRTSFRITTDVFQQERDTVNRSWQVRAKYAYLQYDYLRSTSWRANARLGLLHNVVIDHDESFWPRWLSTVPTDRHGYFSSADAGIATQMTLPGARGELYATIVNGPGFTSRETDRFKDFAARVTLTPLAAQTSNPWRSLALSAWAYKGSIGSRFAQGGAGQLGSVGAALRRDRWGTLAAVSHPRVLASAQYAHRTDGSETGSNTAASPRAVSDSAGALVSAYALVRPFGAAGSPRGRAGLIFRWDHVTPNTDRGGSYDLRIAGLMWELTRRASLALDLQHQAAGSGLPIAETRTAFLRLVALF